MKTPQNVVKFRLDGFPLDALDQTRMRHLRITSDRTGVPIAKLIREALDQTVEAWKAEAELPRKIVKFPAAARYLSSNLLEPQIRREFLSTVEWIHERTAPSRNR